MMTLHACLMTNGQSAGMVW